MKAKLYRVPDLNWRPSENSVSGYPLVAKTPIAPMFIDFDIDDFDDEPNKKVWFWEDWEGNISKDFLTEEEAKRDAEKHYHSIATWFMEAVQSPVYKLKPVVWNKVRDPHCSEAICFEAETSFGTLEIWQNYGALGAFENVMGGWIVEYFDGGTSREWPTIEEAKRDAEEHYRNFAQLSLVEVE